MPIRIATAPVSWGIMEMSEFAWRRSSEDVLDEIAASGYVGTELGPYGFLPTDAAQLKQTLVKRKLSLLGAFVPLPLTDAQRYEDGLQSALQVAELLSEAGAPLLVLAAEMDRRRMEIAGAVTDADGLTPDQWSRAAEMVTSVARQARAFGLRSVFHHHAGTYIETPRELDRLLSLTDPDLLGVCLDTGHYYYGGGDPLECVRQHAGRIWHLHLKDVRGEVLDQVRREKLPYLEAVRQGLFCELGQGAVDITGVLRELEQSGFDGWAVVEQDIDPDQPGIQPAESAARSRAYLRHAAGV